MPGNSGKHRKKKAAGAAPVPSFAFIFLSCRDRKHITHALGSLQKVRHEHRAGLELVFAFPEGAEKIRQHIENAPELEWFRNNGRLRLVPEPSVDQPSGKERMKQPVEELSADLVFLLRTDRLEKKFNPGEFYQWDLEQYSEQPVLHADFRDAGQDIPRSRDCIRILSKEAADYIFGLNGLKTGDLFGKTDLFVRKSGLRPPRIPVHQTDPFGPSPEKESNIRTNPLKGFRFWWEWNFMIPLDETGKGMHRKISFLKEPSIYRSFFALAALLCLVVLPLISLEAGISGDDEKHYEHAVKVYQYFRSGGENDAALDDPTHKLHFYGQSFDLLTHLVIKALNIENIYRARHFMTGLAGALTIITAGFLGRFLAGYGTGCLVMLLMFIFPRFLGHSMNNPLDIPFALGYIFTIYQSFRFLKRLPHFSLPITVWMTLGMAFTVSIRIGGLILVPYIFFFAACYLFFTKWDFRFFSKPWLRIAGRGFLWLSAISAGGYLLSLIPWPYGREAPFSHPFNALKMMSNITVSLRVLYDNTIYWSNRLPWHYISKNILITVPVLILAGFLLALGWCGRARRNIRPLWVFFLYFSVLFPIAYLIYKNSNVYGGWRHLIFVFPSMAVLSGLGLKYVYGISGGRIYRFAMWLLLVAGITHPVIHIVRNYPYQYIYFNEAAGGLKNAYGKYETDYFLNSLKGGSEWLIKNRIMPAADTAQKKIIVASNAPIGYYFRNRKETVKTTYTRYYSRGHHDWDYAILVNNFINPYQLTHDLYPPKNTIHTIDVNGLPVCAVVERESKHDYRGHRLLAARQYSAAIPVLKQAISENPANEAALLDLAQAYLEAVQYEESLDQINRCLQLYPDYDKALNLMGIAYLNQKNLDKAMNAFRKTIRVNEKFVTAYHNLALVYLRKNDIYTAIEFFRKAIQVNSRYKPSYLALAHIYRSQGNQDLAARYEQAAKGL